MVSASGIQPELNQVEPAPRIIKLAAFEEQNPLALAETGAWI
jgi:hypothetical protein